MPPKEDSDYMISETGNWNVADQFAKSKIMRPLIRCEYYEDIATFGYESIIEELANFQSPPNDVIRIRAMKRLIKELIRVIDNAKFALKKSGTKQTALKYKKLLQDLELLIPDLIRVSTNKIKGIKTISIKSIALFDEVLGQVSQIKSKINEPLNANHLIFTDKEEFNARGAKDNFKKRMIEQG